jgi:hypothetical protein
MGMTRAAAGVIGFSTAATNKLLIGGNLLTANSAHYRDGNPATGTGTAIMVNLSGSIYELSIPTSSIRNKLNFRPFTDAELDEFLTVAADAVGTFKWRANVQHDHKSPFKQGVRDWGAIAERFDDAGLEAFVYYEQDPDDHDQRRPRSLAYEKMVAPLIAEVGRLRDRVAVLEAA